MENETIRPQTYQDYLGWPDGEKAELINGTIHAQAAPTSFHQFLVGELFAELRTHLKGKPCKPFLSPFEVRLFADEKTVLQPDVLAVCRQEKIKEWGCNGAPDFIAEVLSPSTSRHDRITKRQLYTKAGVREYWMIDPMDRAVEVLTLADGGAYLSRIYEYIPGEAIQASSSIFDGFSMDLNTLFGG